MVGWGNKLFSSTMHDFSKTVGKKLLLMTNRELHLRFRLAPRSMTLRSNFRRILLDFADLGGNNC